MWQEMNADMLLFFCQNTTHKVKLFAEFEFISARQEHSKLFFRIISCQTHEHKWYKSFSYTLLRNMCPILNQ